MAKFINTAAALAEFDATAAARNAAWTAIERDADVAVCEAADKAALEAVQKAFYEDTKAYNSLDNCLRVHVGDIRRIASSQPKT